MQYKKLWIALGLVMLVSFAVLGGRWLQRRSATGPPIPSKVVTADGRVLFTGETIRNGQNVWQSTGGQEIGTIWGHGAYVAPDWSADYLHRQSVIVLDRWAQAAGFANYAAHAGRTARRSAGPAHRSHPAQFLRSSDRHHRARQRPRGRIRRTRGLLCRHLWQGTQRIRHSRRRTDRRHQAARDGDVLLVDGVGGEHESSRTGRHLHAELAA